MDGFTKVIESKLLPIANKISTNKFLSSVSGGFMAALPVTLIGAIATLIATLQLPGYSDFMVNSGLRDLILIIAKMTTDILSLYVVFLIGYSFAGNTGHKNQSVSVGVLSLFAFLILTPIAAYVPDGAKNPAAVIPFEWLGSKGMFMAIIIGLVVGWLYCFIIDRGWVIKMPEGVPPTVSKSFSALIPAFIIAVIFIIIRGLFGMTEWGSAHQFIYSILQVPLSYLSNNFLTLIIFTLIAQLLWFFGIHGILVILPFVMAMWLPATMENQAALAAGEAMPNILTMGFWSMATLTGASGCTLGIMIIMAFRAKSERYKLLTRLSLPGNICGINEPVVFGTPIVLNPMLFIPFVLAPIATAVISYVLVITGIVPVPIGIQLPLGTPVIFQGFLQGGWIWGLVQVGLIAISGLIYYPFFKALDDQALAEEKGTTVADELAEEATTAV